MDSHHTKEIADGVLVVGSLHENDQKRSMDYPGGLGGGHITIFTIHSIMLKGGFWRVGSSK